MLVKANNLQEGDIIYFEYEHNYNSKSRAMRYKRGLFLGFHHYYKNKCYVILQGLHGSSWNKTVTFCEIDRLYEKQDTNLVGDVKK